MDEHREGHLLGCAAQYESYDLPAQGHSAEPPFLEGGTCEARHVQKVRFDFDIFLLALWKVCITFAARIARQGLHTLSTRCCIRMARGTRIMCKERSWSSFQRVVWFFWYSGAFRHRHQGCAGACHGEPAC